MFRHPLFQYFVLYTGPAILFYHLLNSIHVPPPLFSIFYPIHRFCHPVLPSSKYYTCSAAPFFNIFFLYTGSAILFYHLLNSIHVPPPPFSIFFLYTGSAILFYHLQTVYMFRRPLIQSFFLYTGSAILFYHLLNSIHVPPPPFSIFFPIYRSCHPVLPSFKQYTCSAAPFFNLLSYTQVLPSCFTIF